jgi:hypothetical protein
MSALDLISWHQFIFRTKIATVEILREIELSDPLYDVRLLSRDRLRPFHSEECEPESHKNKQETDKNKQESDNGEQSGSSSRYFRVTSVVKFCRLESTASTEV